MLPLPSKGVETGKWVHTAVPFCLARAARRLYILANEVGNERKAANHALQERRNNCGLAAASLCALRCMCERASGRIQSEGAAMDQCGRSRGAANPRTGGKMSIGGAFAGISRALFFALSCLQSASQL